MKKKLIILLAMILMFVMVNPVLGANVEYNGSNYSPSAGIVIQNGTSFIQADALQYLLGATVEVQSNNQVLMTKNGSTLLVTPGSAMATFNGSDLPLSAAPFMQGNKVMLPLRAVLTAFGAQVGWNPQTSAVTVNFAEKVNGMTAEEMLSQSTQKMIDENSYRAVGDMDLSLSFSGINDPSIPGSINIPMSFDISYQLDPLVMYSRQELNMEGIPAMSSTIPTVTETIIKDGVIYSNLPGMGWVKLDFLDLEELQAYLKNNSTQNPAAALAQLQDFGLIAAYAGEATLDGQEYWIINATLDPATYSKQITDMMKGNDLGGLGEMISQMVSGMNLDLGYVTYVNKNTMLSDKMDMGLTIKIQIPNPENPNEVLTMEETMSGVFTYSDFGQPIAIPDIDFASIPDISQIQVPATDNAQID